MVRRPPGGAATRLISPEGTEVLPEVAAVVLGSVPEQPSLNAEIVYIPELEPQR